MIVIGITGTIGAGKGTIVKYLVNKKGFKHFSVRNYLLQMLKKQCVFPDRNAMVNLANELRMKFGNAYIIQKLYEEVIKQNDNAVIESIRHPDEVNFLKKNCSNFYLFSVDASQIIRYNRILQRQSSTDFISFERFVEEDKREFYGGPDASQNIEACMRLSDFHFINDDTIDKLYEQVENSLKKLNL